MYVRTYVCMYGTSQKIEKARQRSTKRIFFLGITIGGTPSKNGKLHKHAT